MSIKIGNSASNSNRLCDFKLNSVDLPESESCKYLAGNIDFDSIQKDLVNTEKWLNANRLSLNSLSNEY